MSEETPAKANGKNPTTTAVLRQLYERSLDYVTRHKELARRVAEATGQPTPKLEGDRLYRRWLLDTAADVGIPPSEEDNEVLALQIIAAARARSGGTPPASAEPEADPARIIAVCADSHASEVYKIGQNQSKSADDRMAAIYALDRRARGWKSPRWAEILGVTDQAVRQTTWWRNRANLD